jgi:3-dehydroquinate synthase
LRNQGLDVELLEFPAGEESKTPETAIFLGRELARKGLDRNSIIIAFGGGVVGDLAGYVASFYKRGINYVQVPTTLLAQVDSSIGGKTGVDIPEGKNMFGSFYQPKAVLADVETLGTLPEREIRNGLAEIIKYGVTQDKELFEDLEENFSFKNFGFYLRIVEKSCRIKAKIVEKDERESELRKILNYGHTIGHAIEAAERYRISHGDAVGLGMVYEGKISSRLGLLDKDSLHRQNQLIEKVGLPVKYEGNLDSLIEFVKRDKKNTRAGIYFVLPNALGAVKCENGKIAFPVDEALVRECLRS